MTRELPSSNYCAASQIASELSSAATELEKEALPALDNLTKRVSTHKRPQSHG